MSLPTFGLLESAFTYRNQEHGTSFYGLYEDTEYPAGGYSWYLNIEDFNVRERIRVMENSGWIDESTRVIIIDSAIYNLNHNIWVVSRQGVEFTGSGLIVPSFLIRSQL